MRTMLNDSLKWTHYGVAGLLLVVYVIVFARESIVGCLFFFPFIVSPIVINLALARWARAALNQALLLPLTVAYSVWAVYLYRDAMIVHLDPQSPIVLLFTGIFALPALLPTWAFIAVWEWWYRRSS